MTESADLMISQQLFLIKPNLCDDSYTLIKDLFKVLLFLEILSLCVKLSNLEFIKSFNLVSIFFSFSLSSTLFGTTSSAAFVGVAATLSDARSESVLSVE